MDLLGRMRERLNHFMGRDLDEDPESRLRSEAADREFQAALRSARLTRKGFDSRPPAALSEPGPAMSLESLQSNLEAEDALVRQALEDDDGT